MKKSITLLLFISLTLFISISSSANIAKYEVTEPVTIEWWHSLEDQLNPYIDEMIAQFQAENPLITVHAIFIDSLSKLPSHLMAAIAAGEVPALCNAQMEYVASYGNAGIAEVLDPYIKAYDFDMADFGEGLVSSVSYFDQVVAMPFLTSTQAIHYNQTAADAEGITLPKTFDDMEAFLEKATLFNDDGSTARYGTVFAGWNYWYFKTLFSNNGVEVVLEDGLTSDINSPQAIYLVTKMKEWIDKGYAYYAYGTGAASNMRQMYWDGKAFSVFHTSAIYDTYIEQTKDAFETSMAWLPGGNDGVSFNSEVGGSNIIIPAIASQIQKNAAWQFMMFMASPEINLYWADHTGYFPTRQSVRETKAYEEYLSKKPSMNTIVSMGNWIQPGHPHPAFSEVGTEWRHALATIFIEDAPVRETLDKLKVTIEDILEDY